MPPNYRAIARRDALAFGLDPKIFINQIQQESGFDPNAHSPAGADGIAQFMPFWHVPHDPVIQLRKAAAVMASYVKKYGSYARALSAYNSGKPDAYKDPNFAKGQTYRYVRNILGGADPKEGVSQAVASGAVPFMGAPTNDLRANLLGFIQKSLAAQAQGQPAQVADFTQFLLSQPLSKQLANASVSAPKASSGDSTADPGGFNPEFAKRLSAFEKAAGIKVTSGYRSVKEQEQLWQNALKKYGSAEAARKWVAPPGHSNHNKGIAADLSGNLALAHKLAPQFGLVFPMPWEPWHVELAGGR